jgi:hypothetical protein
MCVAFMLEQDLLTSLTVQMRDYEKVSNEAEQDSAITRKISS